MAVDKFIWIPNDWIDLIFHEQLLKRKKHQRLTRGQRDYLIDILNIFPNLQSLIKNEYNILPSTYNQLKSDFKENEIR